eukprot:6466783-Amphidinium_carterae.1
MLRTRTEQAALHRRNTALALRAQPKQSTERASLVELLLQVEDASTRVIVSFARMTAMMVQVTPPQDIMCLNSLVTKGRFPT